MSRHCIDRGINDNDLNFIISKPSAIIIRSKYYIFCMRNKAFSNPELLSYQSLCIQLLCVDCILAMYFKFSLLFIRQANKNFIFLLVALAIYT